MDKILVPMGSGPKNRNVNVTNDGATILRSMHVDNPAAKILIGTIDILFRYLKNSRRISRRRNYNSCSLGRIIIEIRIKINSYENTSTTYHCWMENG
jgi:hypothetical protein